MISNEGRRSLLLFFPLHSHITSLLMWLTRFLHTSQRSFPVVFCFFLPVPDWSFPGDLYWVLDSWSLFSRPPGKADNTEGLHQFCPVSLPCPALPCSEPHPFSLSLPQRHACLNDRRSPTAIEWTGLNWWELHSWYNWSNGSKRLFIRTAVCKAWVLCFHRNKALLQTSDCGLFMISL